MAYSDLKIGDNVAVAYNKIEDIPSEYSNFKNTTVSTLARNVLLNSFSNPSFLIEKNFEWGYVGKIGIFSLGEIVLPKDIEMNVGLNIEKVGGYNLENGTLKTENKELAKELVEINGNLTTIDNTLNSTGDYTKVVKDNFIELFQKLQTNNVSTDNIDKTLRKTDESVNGIDKNLVKTNEKLDTIIGLLENLVLNK